MTDDEDIIRGELKINGRVITYELTKRKPTKTFPALYKGWKSLEFTDNEHHASVFILPNQKVKDVIESVIKLRHWF